MEELAAKSGVSRVSINRYELGQRIPDVTIARKIAEALSCTIEELLENDERRCDTCAETDHRP